MEIKAPHFRGSPATVKQGHNGKRPERLERPSAAQRSRRRQRQKTNFDRVTPADKTEIGAAWISFASATSDEPDDERRNLNLEPRSIPARTCESACESAWESITNCSNFDVGDRTARLSWRSHDGQTLGHAAQCPNSRCSKSEGIFGLQHEWR